MTAVPRVDIADVLARSDLAALLDQLTQRDAGSRRWHCPIPGHDDDHASVTIFTDHRGHQRWRCWSGDDTHRGDAIDLVAIIRRLSRGDAIAWLADRLPNTAFAPAPSPLRRAAPVTPAELSPLVVDYARCCAELLWTVAGEPVRIWLERRGFAEAVLRVNHVGADPGRRLLPRRRGLPAGTTPAATFPTHDATGAITYVQTRYFNPGDRPKYDNPVGRLGPNPRLSWIRPPNTPRPGLLIICEGIPDALTAAQTGYRAVALLGSHAAV
jgi:hypothetical protein